MNGGSAGLREAFQYVWQMRGVDGLGRFAADLGQAHHGAGDIILIRWRQTAHGF